MAVPDPEYLKVKPPHGVKPDGRKEGHLSGLSVNRMEHYLSPAQLTQEFGENGCKQLPDAVMKHYRFVPQRLKWMNTISEFIPIKDHRMVKAPHLSILLRGSLVSASLGAAIMNAKYVNRILLHRMENEFVRYSLSVDRKNMASWMIRLSEEYLGVLYDRLHEKLPIDKKASERVIRGFCIGRQNWQMIDTINGAKSSPTIYSIAETAKANHLKPYEYFEYLLAEIPKHMADQNMLFIEDLLPCRQNCRNPSVNPQNSAGP